MAAARATDFGPAFDDKPAGIDRRQLLRAGAWAAPALILATAAPAAAAQSVTPVSSTPLSVGTPTAWMVTSHQGGSAKSAGLQGFLQIEKQWAQNATTVGPFTIVITVPKNNGFTAATPTVRGGAPGWSAVSGVVSGANIVYTFLNSQVITNNGYWQLQLEYALPGDNKNINSMSFPFTLTQTVAATGGTGNTTSTSIAKP